MNLFKRINIIAEYFIFFILENVLPSPKKYNYNSILFVNTGRMGDLIISSIILENPLLLSRYKQIKFIIKEEYLELFSDYNGKIEFVGYNPIKYKLFIIYKIKFLKQIRSMGFDRCYNLTAARGIINEEITLLSEAKQKYYLNNNLKYLGKYFGKKLNKRYTQNLFSQIKNEYEKHISLLRKLSERDNVKVSFYNSLTFKENTQSRINHTFKKNKIKILIAPISSENKKDWPLDKFSNLLKMFNEGFSVIILGTLKQKKMLEKISHDEGNVRILAGVLEFKDLILLFKKTNIFIGLDSGLTHLALKLGAPLVAIIGGGSFQRFFPFMESVKAKFLYKKMDCFGCEWDCIYDKKHCIEDISEDEVFREIEKILHLENS